MPNSLIKASEDLRSELSTGELILDTTNQITFAITVDLKKEIVRCIYSNESKSLTHKIIESGCVPRRK